MHVIMLYIIQTLNKCVLNVLPFQPIKLIHTSRNDKFDIILELIEQTVKLETDNFKATSLYICIFVNVCNSI